jgi:tetratricopeptide (TPR) repeat protein
LRLDLANGYLKLGDVLGHRLGFGDSLGYTAQAIESNRKAMALAAPLVRQHPDNAAARRALATAQERLGVSLNIAGRFQEGAPWLAQAADAFEHLAVANPRDARSLQDAGSAWFVFGKQLSEKGAFVTFDAEKPLAYLHKAIGEFEAALRISPNNPAIVKLLAMTYESKGRIESTPNPSLGMNDYTAALDLLTRLPDAEQQTVDVRELRAMMLLHLGWDKGQLNDFKGALADLELARPVLDDLAASDPKNLGAAFRRVDLYRSIGLIHGYAGHKAESLENLRKAVEILDWAVPRDPANVTYPLLRAELQNKVANLLTEAHRDAEAQPYAEAGVAYFRNIGESPNATVPQLMEAARWLSETGVKSLRDYPAALGYALRADQLAQGKNPAALGYVAEAYALNGDKAKAIAAAQRGLALVPPTKPAESPSQLRKWLEDEVKEYQAPPKPKAWPKAARS